MKIISDLHIHSKHARACSKRLDVEFNWKFSILKGIDLLGTGDFTHPKWLEELKQFTESDNNGFLIPKKKFRDNWIDDLKENLSKAVLNKIENGFFPRFVLQTEINSVFQRGIKKSRIHNCILIDNLENAEKLLSELGKYGNVESDGRLAVKQDQIETLKWLKSNFLQSIFIPAHIWTPYFGVLGSRFGFESLKEAYGDSYMLIDALETGLSSDPLMNWINSEIDPFEIISTSDAHSPENFAREATVFNYSGNEDRWNITYKDLERSLKSRKNLFKDKFHDIEKKYLEELFQEEPKMIVDSTIEFFPQEGKYFGDGHKKCNFLTTPSDTVKKNGKCPICGGNITIGVAHRSYNIGDNDRIKQTGYGTKNMWQQNELNCIAKTFDRPGYKYIVPIRDIIREVWSANKGTKKSEKYFDELIKIFGSEFYILLELSIEDAKKYDEKFAWALEKVRNSDIYIRSGFDGNFGVVSIEDKKEDNVIQDYDGMIQDSLF